MAADELQALIPGVWRAAIDGAVLGTELTQLARRLGDENREVLPPREQWFRALEVTPLTEVRAVILGQDPYPTEGRADGLAFSVPDGQPAPTRSLRRILGEAAQVATIASGQTSLLRWAERGVLLLNTALTVPNSGGRADTRRSAGSP